MKRKSLGSAVVDYEYWSGGKGSQELKCNETILYSEIDLLQSRAQFARTEEELQSYYSKMDLMYMCVKAIEFCGSNDDLLACAGALIGNYKADGCFAIRFDRVEDENRYLDGLVEEMKESLSPDTDTDVPVNDPIFDEWYHDNVVSFNYYNTPDGQSKDMPSIALGATGTDDYTARMKDGAMSLLYYNADTSLLYDGCANREEMSKKIFEASRAVNWFASKGTNMTSRSIRNAIESGIIENTGGLSQEEAIRKFKKESTEGVNGLGFDVVGLITAIAMAITAIASLISVIAKFRSSNSYDFPDDPEPDPDPDYFAPDASDWANEAMAQADEMLRNSGAFTAKEVFAVLGVACVGLVGAVAMIFGDKKKER